MHNTARSGGLAAVALAVLAHVPASAATTDTPLAHEFIQQHGSRVGREEMLASRAIYARYLEEAGHPKAAKTRDVSYGPHARHRLDVFRPSGVESGAPVLLFVHGGGFVSGDKGDGVIFDNVLDYFAARGVMGVNINYRLAPEYQWPAGAEDIGRALQWVRDHARAYGGDPARVFIMGHSAGAAHVAAYAFTESLQPADGADGVRGVILVSGTYSGNNLESQHVYYGDDVTAESGRLPANNVDGRRIPLFVIDGEYDYPMMQREALELVRRVCERDGQCPRHQQVPGHNHFSILHHVNTADDSVAHDIAGFIRQWSAR